jgi:DNA-binding NtrC family response regulator
MSKSGASLKVLYGELNEQVLASQAVVLEKAGHKVQTALGRKAVQNALSKGAFDLVILGPTLTRDDRHHLPYMVKKAHAETRVLVMHTDGSRHPYVDGNTDTGESMERLLEKISAQQTKTTAAAAGR